MASQALSDPQIPSPASALRPRYATSHGCAWLEIPPAANPRASKVIASVAGLPSKSFSSLDDLDPGVTWWTSLTKAQIWMLGTAPSLRHDSLLGVPWSLLLAEHGQRPDADSVAYWSEAFARAAERLSALTSMDGHGVWSWGHGTLAEAIYDVLQNHDQLQDVSKDMQPVFTSSHLETLRLSEPARYRGSGMRRVVLSLPRLEHALEISTAPVPRGPFVFLSDSEWPRQYSGRLEWLAAQAIPTLVRLVDVEPLDGMRDAMDLHFGLRGRKFPSALPDPVWLTAEEARSLACMARFSLVGAAQGRSWSRPPENSWLLSLAADPMSHLSPVVGLLGMGCLEASLLGPRHLGHSSRTITASAIWKAAASRNRCATAAAAMAACGITVSSYGNGRVEVLLARGDDLTAFATAVRSSGLVLPCELARRLPLPPDASAQDAVSLRHWLYATGGSDALRHVDRLVAPWLGPAVEVRALLMESASALIKLPSPDTKWRDCWADMLRAQVPMVTSRLKAAARSQRS